MPTRPALQVIRDEHAAVAAVLRSLLQMLERGPDQEPERFFDVLRAMLFYIDEFPERRHHPHEWQIIAEADGRPTNAWRTWIRLQLALRSPVLPALEDGAITRWRRAWRYSLWAAWACWFIALGIQFSAR